MIFLSALAFSFYGVLPYEDNVALSVPEEIKEHKVNALKTKRKWLSISGSLMLFGFALALAGIIAKVF